MKASKLAAIINSFEPEEKKQFQKYIESPFFNTNDTLVYLWNFLPTKFSIKHDELNSKRIWKKLDMVTTYTDDAFRKLLSKLNQLAEDFIAYQEYNNPTDKQIYFLQACNARKLSKHFASGDRQTNQIVKQDDYYNNFCVDYNRDLYEYNTGQKRTHILSAMESLDNFYIKNKLQIYNLYFSTQYSQNNTYQAVGFKHFVAYAEKKIANNIMFQFYYCLASIFNYEKVEGNKLWQFLEDDNAKNINEAQQKQFYKGIKSQLTLKDNVKGEIENTITLAHLYETLHKKQYLYDGEHLSIVDYKQAVIFNLRAGKERIKWAYEFMCDNKQYLEIKHRENTYFFCAAYYHFIKKEYFNSLEYIQKIEIEEEDIDKKAYYYLIHHNFLALQNFYEMEDFDKLLTGISNFRKDINSHTTLSPTTIRTYLNAISMLNNILKLRQGNQKKGNVFYKKIKHTANIYKRAWLLAKLKMKMLPKSNVKRKPIPTYSISSLKNNS